VRWLPSFGATAYDLFRSTTSGGGYTLIAGNFTNEKTSYVDTNVSAGITYYYVARAKNAAGASGDFARVRRRPASVLPINLAFSGTASASFSGQWYEAPDKAFDNVPDSKWYGWNAPTGWLQYDFGANSAQIVKHYTLVSADVADRDPRSWNFLGSQDGVSWTTLDSQVDQVFAYRLQQLAYEIGNTAAYRYYRLEITANNGAGGVAIAELGLWGDSGRTIPDGSYRIVSRNSNKGMDVTGIADGAQVVQRTFDGDDSQQWHMVWEGNGRYRVTNVAGARVLDNGDSSSAGDNLVILPWSGGAGQLWEIVPDGDGFFRIQSANSALVADVSGGSTADGAMIVQSTHSGSDSQQWTPAVAATPQPIPPAPTGLAATPASISEIDLSWTASPGAISYSIKRAVINGGPYTTVAVSVNATNYPDTGLASATTYYYVVSAVNGSGESSNSAQASATTLAAPPAAPTGLTAMPGHHQATLSWTASAATTGYHVQRASTSGGPYTTVATGLTSTNFTDTGLTNGIAYYYVVSASNAIGAGPDSAEVSVTPSPVVVHLEFDETGGAVAADSSGRSQHAALVNAPGFAAGYLGNALHFTSAASQYAAFPNGIMSGLTDFTIAAWIKVNAFSTWQRIFDFGDGTANYMFLTTQYTGHHAEQRQAPLRHPHPLRRGAKRERHGHRPCRRRLDPRGRHPLRQHGFPLRRWFARRLRHHHARPVRPRRHHPELPRQVAMERPVFQRRP
jgi:fibronectin type 3 domain-containing protein